MASCLIGQSFYDMMGSNGVFKKGTGVILQAIPMNCGNRQNAVSFQRQNCDKPFREISLCLSLKTRWSGVGKGN